MDLKWTMKFQNAIFAMKTLIIMRVLIAVFEYVLLATLLVIDANVPKIDVGLVGNLLVYPDLILLTIIGTTKANVCWKVQKFKTFKVAVNPNLRITKYQNAKYVKNIPTISRAKDAGFVFAMHAVVADTIVLATTNLAITLGTTAMKNLGIPICRIILTVKMKTALHW